ncbi:hypothetical protein EZJ43_06180 [Pedobacter changchengzhani]|uniref:Uncharacterized protein n=1 Tax=Pedobacter changchengzhani TaxID=2529274 RepID=A0A4R5MNH6_9SPHI|nr:hypothetical protein [Pedobacter changchengzhani]TDG36865.1 hypothetical protein EZJ43_06180 [Pedobacter changchengzhani]
MTAQTKNIALSAIYFGLSTVITGWFIFIGKDFYSSFNNMALSGAIAGGKWGLQIFMALIFVGFRKWEFVKEIGFVCLIGSLLLLTYYPIGFFGITNGWQFIYALAIAVLGMIILYYRAIINNGFPIKWFIRWVCCLAIAIILQLTVVFHII